MQSVSEGEEDTGSPKKELMLRPSIRRLTRGPSAWNGEFDR